MKTVSVEINNCLKNDAVGFIKECNDYYHNEIFDIAKRISDDDRIKIVAISGPSGAGKTTTAHLLCQALEALDENTDVVSLDDFYLEPGKHPLSEDGSPDLESVHALDIPLIKSCFDDIIKYGKTILPSFDFKNEARISAARTLDIGQRGIVIVEGLHALNPVISELVPRENIFKIYISVNVTVKDDKENKLLSSRQVRLIRRTLRDNSFRGSDVNETLGRWSSVVAGEEKYLYCFKDTADVKVITFHPYELGVYKKDFLNLLPQIEDNTPCKDYFISTADALRAFDSVVRSLVPKDSLIREFIGQDL